MHEHDPDRLNDPRRSEPVRNGASPRLALTALLVLAIVVLTFAFWPSMNTSTQVTDNTPVYRAPADSPPASPPPQ